MRIPRVYVDTSVFGGTQDPQFAAPSRRFFAQAHEGQYVVLISQITIAELAEAPGEVRAELANLPDDALEEIVLDPEIDELAKKYIDAGVLGESKQVDAAHVAAATVARADLLLSWNFKHLVNFARIRRFNAVNMANGYPQIEIRSPLEVGETSEDEEV